MHLCARKFKHHLFRLEGFRGSNLSSPHPPSHKTWKYIDPRHASSTSSSSTPGSDPITTKATLERFLNGTTGTGLIDASQRELLHTGYTSNRARQNVASFLATHLGIDWRLGAEFYESLLIDYDAASNWGNWQYVAGVGNDPRQGRTFNPVKQGLDYDPEGKFVKAWVEELRGADGGSQEGLMGVIQAWRLSQPEKERLGLSGVECVERPLVRIPFEVGRKPGSNSRRARGRGRGRGRGDGYGRGERSGRREMREM